MQRILIATLLTLFLGAQAQTIDTDFDVKSGIGNSKNGGVRVIKTYSEGYLIGGFFDSFQGQPFTALVKVDAAGVVDEKFAVRFEPAEVYDLAILPDNSIIAVGAFQKVNEADHAGIVKILPDGTLDENFRVMGLTRGGTIRTIALDDKEESAFIGGNFEEYEGENWNNIARIKAVDGVPINEFTPVGSKGGTGIYDIDYLRVGGRMIVAGEFDTFNDESYQNIIRIFDDGSTDDSFKPITTKGRFNAVDIATKDNSVLIGGTFDGINGAKIFDLGLLDASGNPINEFNAGEIIGQEIYNVEFPDNGPLVIVGDFASVSGLSRPNISLINPNNGQAVAAIGPGSGTDRPGYAISPGVNGGIVIGGDYTTYDCEVSNGVSKIQLENAGETTISISQLDVTEYCSGDELNVSFTASGNFCDNMFQVQLSNSTGSFENPTVIGSETADVERGKAYSSSIKAQLPTSLANGNNYAIRIVGTSPGVVSNEVSPLSISAELGTTGPISGPSSACQGEEVTYSISPVAGATDYAWSVPVGSKIVSGDGTTGITVAIAGNSGNVTVTPAGGCGKGTERSLPVSIQSTPSSNLGNVFGPDALCRGVTAEYGFDGGGGNYIWTVPTGVNILSGQGTSTISVRPTASAVAGQISVIESNACGTSDPSTVEVDIFQIQDAGPIVASNETPCDDETVTLTVSDVGASNFSWQQFDGITEINSSETSYSFITNGNSGTITYNFSFNQCGDGISFSTPPVSINTIETPGDMGALSIPNLICENETGVVMSVPPVTGATGYQWTLPSDVVITSGDDTESITVDVGTSSGLISVAAYNDCGFGDGSQEDNLTLSRVPESLGPISGPAIVCENEGASYSVVRPARIANYVWSLPLGATFGSDPNSNSIEVNFASTGGTISVANQNACGVGPASVLTVDMNQLPVVGQISGPLTPCEQSTGIEYQVPPVTGVNSYSWSGSGVEIVTQNDNIATVNIGSSPATISLEVRNGCGTDQTELTFNPAPFPGDAGSISGPSRMCPESQDMTYFIDPVADATTYAWSIPEGATITKGDGTSAILVDFAAQDGIISVTPQNSCGSGGSAETSIAFDPLPQGTPVVSGETNPCPGGVYSFTTGAIKFATGYSWSLPPEATIVSGGGRNVNIRFGETSGNVTVTPFNTCGNGQSTSLPVVIDMPPVLSGISGPEEVCEGEIATYSIDPVTDATNYTWTVPADALSDPGTTTTDIQFGQESGTVIVEVSDACNTRTQSLEVMVNPFPGNAGAITGPKTVCESEEGVSYEIFPVANATNYIWSGPAGSSISNNGSNSVTIDFNDAPGFIRVQPSNLCGTGESRQIEVQFNVLEETQPISGPGNTCPFTVESFTVPEVEGATSYDWSSNNGFILSGNGTNSIELETGFSGGTISVTPQGECGEGASTDFTYVVNNVQPDAGSFQLVCGNSTTLNANLNPGETGTWSVASGNGDFSDPNDPNAEVTNLAEGYNEFRWEVTNGTCSSSATVSIEVSYPVTPSVSIAAGSNPICSGELTSFSANAQNGGANPVFIWRKNGTGVGTDAPTFSDATLVDGDQITLEMTSSQTCVTSSLASSNTITMSVSSTVTPSVAIEADNNTVCDGNSLVLSVVDSTGGGATPTFQWYKNGSTVGTGSFLLQETSPVDGDEFYVEMNSSSSCASVAMATSTVETITVQTPPTVGQPQSYQVCSGEGVVNLIGSFAGASGVQWTTDGEGTFTDPTSPNTQYNLAGFDFNSSFLSLTMQTTGNGACPPAYAFNTLEVLPSPQIFLGDDIIICSDEESVDLSVEVVNESSFQWSTSGSGTFSPTAINSSSLTYTPSAADISNGTITLTVTATATGCNEVSETLTLNILPTPVADAGSDQQVCGGSTTLAATTLNAGETGIWSVFTGGANFADEANPTSGVTGLQPGDNELIWQVTEGNCLASDTILINRGSVTVARVEADKTSCELSTAITGNTPAGTETGQWSVESGTGTFDDSSSPSTSVSGLTPNANNTFSWTITRGACTSTDILSIEQITPTQASAGSDMEVCADSVMLAGNSPSAGEIGLWSQTLGEGLIANATSTTTKVNFLSEGENKLVYAIENGTCFSYDTITVTNNEIQLSPIAASSICGNEATLSANINQGETGSWTVIEGAGTFVDDADPATLVQGMEEGTNRYRFIASQGACTDTVFQTVNAEYITTPSAVVSVGTNPICNNELTSFSAVITEGGASPTLQWKLNGTDVGNGTAQYESSTLVDGDEVSLTLTSNKTCVTTPSVSSNIITMVVTNNVVPTTAISVTEDSLCGVQPITFTVVDSTGGGNNPTFEWFRNGAILFGNNGNQLTVTDVTDEEEFFVRMTTSSTCATKSYDSSDVAGIRVFEVPEANAGSDFVTCDPDIQLNGNALSGSQVGSWTIETTSAAQFEDSSLPSAIVGDLPAGNTNFIWTVSQEGVPNCEDSDTVMVDHIVLSPEAGPAQVIRDDFTTITGNDPGQASAGWTALNPNNILTPTSETSADVSGLEDGVNRFVWTFTFNGCSDSDTVVVNYQSNLPLAEAGPDQSVCFNNTTMDATPVQPNETGIWSLYQGAADIDDATDPNTAISNIAQGKNIFVWTVDNGLEATDTVVISFDVPVVAVPDTIEVAAGDSIGIDVLTNDTTSGGDQLKLQILRFPVFGQVNVLLDSTVISFESLDPTILGNDTVEYRVFNQCASADTGLVVVQTLNTGPVLELDTINEVRGTSKTLKYAISLIDINLNIDPSSPRIIDRPEELSEDPTIEIINDSLFITLDLSKDPDYTTENDSITYEICDVFAACATSKIYLKITNPDSWEFPGYPEVRPYEAFSPNGDIYNETWEIRGIHDTYLDENGDTTKFYPAPTIQVFNRWGETVFLSKDKEYKPWDGRKEGEDLPDGVYYYVIHLKNGEDNDRVEGSILLKK